MSNDDTTAPDERPAPEPEGHGGAGPGGPGWGLTTAAQAIGWATLVAAVGLWLRVPATAWSMPHGWFAYSPMPRRYADYSAYSSFLTLTTSSDDRLFFVVALVAPAAAAGLVLARRARRLGPGSGTRSATVTTVLALILCAGMVAVAVAVPALAG